MVVRFTFNPRKDFGWKDHFFHFLLGYLLPSLDYSIKNAQRDLSFEDCGPLMERRLVEACDLLGLNLKSNDSTMIGTIQEIQVCRWDICLRRSDGSLPTENFIRKFRKEIDNVRTEILSKSIEVAPPEAANKKCIVVLKRSEPHPYYRTDGPSSFPGYGSERRQLTNSIAIANLIETFGFQAKILDLSTLSFLDQVKTFRDARAVIGARGAEFANVLWMKQASDALMFATPLDKPSHAARTLALTMGVRFAEVPVAKKHFDGPLDAVAAWLEFINKD